MIAPALALFNFLVTRPYNEPLTWGNGIENARVGLVRRALHGSARAGGHDAGDRRRQYLDLANRLWWKTTDFLLDKEESLYYRDSRYFAQREPNGKKVFWSRGNGWVFAGLARMLPSDAGRLPRPSTLRRALPSRWRARWRRVQGEDGYWRSSLLDPSSRPNPETSGVALASPNA